MLNPMNRKATYVQSRGKEKSVDNKVYVTTRLTSLRTIEQREGWASICSPNIPIKLITMIV